MIHIRRISVTFLTKNNLVNEHSLTKITIAKITSHITNSLKNEKNDLIS